MPSKVNAAVGAGADIVREKVARGRCAACGVRCAMCVRCAVSSTNHPSSSAACDAARAVMAVDKRRHRRARPSIDCSKLKSID